MTVSHNCLSPLHPCLCSIVLTNEKGVNSLVAVNVQTHGPTARTRFRNAIRIYLGKGVRANYARLEAQHGGGKLAIVANRNITVLSGN